MHLKLARAKLVLERRLFLKAMGLGLAAPVALKLSRSATAASTGAPKRLFVMYFPHGIPPEHYNPLMGGDGKDPTNFALDMTNESILGPLEPYKKWVNVYNGLQYPNELGTHEGCVNALSGVATFDETSPRTTMDQVIAKGLGVESLVLGACSHQTYGIDLHGKIFWDGTAIDPQKNPAAVADKLFGGLSNTPTVSADEQLRTALLDLTTAELKDLKGTVAGLTKEETKLQTHLDAIEAMKSGGGSSVSTCTTAPVLPTVEKVRKESAGIVVQPGGGNDYFYKDENFRTLFQAQLELTAQALVCNAAQAISLMPMYPTYELDFSFIGGTPTNTNSWAHHNGLSHTTPQQASGYMYNSPVSIANLNPEARATFGRAQRWFFEQLVTNVVDVLSKTPDPSATDGSMVLDNTMIFVFSEIGDGANHRRYSEVMYPGTPEYLPFITIGGAGGGLKTGQVINLPIAEGGKSAPPATNLYLTLAQAMGVANATFPGTTGILEGVLA